MPLPPNVSATICRGNYIIERSDDLRIENYPYLKDYLFQPKNHNLLQSRAVLMNDKLRDPYLKDRIIFFTIDNKLTKPIVCSFWQQWEWHDCEDKFIIDENTIVKCYQTYSEKSGLLAFLEEMEKETKYSRDGFNWDIKDICSKLQIKE